MNIDSAFPSRWLTAGDIPPNGMNVTIKAVSIEQLGAGVNAQQKPCLSVMEDARLVVLNKTNSSVIRSLFGSETDRWIGRVIHLYQDTTEFNGQIVACIRIRHAPMPAPISPTVPARSVPAALPPYSPPPQTYAWAKIESPFDAFKASQAANGPAIPAAQPAPSIPAAPVARSAPATAHIPSSTPAPPAPK